jgi:Ser-tRNA(Ala) deacylase AlaX
MSQIYAFERDPYARELAVEVQRTDWMGDRPIAVLDDTILFPEGGGQPADRGRLGSVEVVDVQRKEGEVLHFLESPVDRGPGQLSLDWARRFDHMQQHSAQHLISRAALDRFGWATKSFHLGPEWSDIELGTAPLTVSDLRVLEDMVCDLIGENRTISCRRVSVEELADLEVRSRGLPADHRGDIRLVEIEGVDLNTCGGTHVRSTAEIGIVKLLRAEPLRGGCRLYWLAGQRVRDRFVEYQGRNDALRSLFDASDNDLLEVAAKKLKRLTDLKRQNRHLEERLATVIAKEIVRDTEPIVEAHLGDLSAAGIRLVAQIFSEQSAHGCAFLTTEDDGQAFFALAVGPESGADLSNLGKQVAEILEGRGGGSRSVFQGKAGSLVRRDEAVALIMKLHSQASEPSSGRTRS